MAISVQECADEDMLAIFTIADRAFARNEPFFDATFPKHWTESGRRVSAERFLKLKQENKSVHYVKAVDSATGQIVGFARWLVFTDHVPEAYKDGHDHGPYWETPHEVDYVHHLLVDFLKPRFGQIEKSGGNAVSLDICAVDPGHQRRGVGAKLVEWGTNKADELGVDAVVESSVCGRGLYEKHGFVFERDVTLEVPERFRPHDEMKFAWLIRPKKTT